MIRKPPKETVMWGMGMGMKTMRDRTEFSGGAFHMESEPGKGTLIAANWPRKA